MITTYEDLFVFVLGSVLVCVVVLSWVIGK